MPNVINEDIEIVLREISLGGSAGNNGTNGADGDDAYMYVGYADDASGTGFSLSPTGKTYVAFKASSTVLTPVVGDFAGLWVKFVGADGSAGNAGANAPTIVSAAIVGNDLVLTMSDASTITATDAKVDGVDGEDAYVYIAYADNATGGGFTNTYDASKDYVAILSTTSPIATPTVTDFTGLWKRVADGLSAYEVWLSLGNTGSETTFIDSLKGNDGVDGSSGADGEDVFLYIGYADDVNGNGFVAPGDTFDPSKKFIGVINSETEILSPAQSDFNGLWVRYLGDGDRWATTSSTSLTIAASGTFALTVEPELAYTTGQEVVIAENGNANNRMTGIVDSYNYATGALVVDVSASNGSGTFNNWAVNLQAASSSNTDLSNTPSASDIEVQSSTGTNTNLPLATESLAGLLSPSEKATMVLAVDETQDTIGGTEFAITYDQDQYSYHEADAGGASKLLSIIGPPMKGLKGTLAVKTFGSDGSPGRAFAIADTDVAATGVLTLTGNLSDGDTVVIGTKTYTAQATLTDVDGNFLIGASASDTIDNLIAAIGLGAGSGSLYAASTTLNADVTAAAGAGDTMDITHKTAGYAGNSTATTETSATASWGAATMTSGEDAVFDHIFGFYFNEEPTMTLEYWKSGTKVFGRWVETSYLTETDPV